MFTSQNSAQARVQDSKRQQKTIQALSVFLHFSLPLRSLPPPSLPVPAPIPPLPAPHHCQPSQTNPGGWGKWRLSKPLLWYHVNAEWLLYGHLHSKYSLMTCVSLHNRPDSTKINNVRQKNHPSTIKSTTPAHLSYQEYCWSPGQRRDLWTSRTVIFPDSPIKASKHTEPSRQPDAPPAIEPSSRTYMNKMLL